MQYQKTKAETKAFEAYRNEHKSIVPVAAKTVFADEKGKAASGADGAEEAQVFPLVTEDEQ